MKLGYSIYLSERVKELLDEGTLDEILQLVRKDIEGEWAQTHPQDVQVREAVYHEMHALTRLETRLKSVIGDLVMKREFQ